MARPLLAVAVWLAALKMFAQKKVTLPLGRPMVVILDEADAMTKSAQHALRRTMEVYSATTRFALTCNNSTKIIEPIQSRAAILHYTKLSNDEVAHRLLQVIAAENILDDDSGLRRCSFRASVTCATCSTTCRCAR